MRAPPDQPPMNWGASLRPGVARGLAPPRRMDVACADAAKERLRRRWRSVPPTSSGSICRCIRPRAWRGRSSRKRARVNPSARICAYGLYAPLNAEWLRSLGVDDVLGGEFEEELPRWPRIVAGSRGRQVECRLRLRPRLAAVAEALWTRRSAPLAAYPRIHFLVPDRTGLPALEVRDAAVRRRHRRIVGYTEASRGCRHLCRHCPVVPIYQRTVPRRAARRRARRYRRAGGRRRGAHHLRRSRFLQRTDHAMRIVEALHAAHPAVTYDVTIKVEHLLAASRAAAAAARNRLPVRDERRRIGRRSRARAARKGHTRADFFEAVALCRAGGLTLVPTFVAFHPWLTPRGYCDLLDTIDDLDLVGHVAPIQLAIRLLIPKGRGCSSSTRSARLVGAFDPETLTYRWRHPIRGWTAPRERWHPWSARVCRPTARRCSTRSARSPTQRAGLGPPAPRPMSRSRHRAVPQRTLVLLRRAQSGAGGSGLRPEYHADS